MELELGFDFPLRPIGRRFAGVQGEEPGQLLERLEVEGVLGPQMLHAAPEATLRRARVETELDDEGPAGPGQVGLGAVRGRMRALD